MKIYCNCNSCGHQVYLASQARSRYQLANIWGITFFINCTLCQSQNHVHVNGVRAETSQGKTPIATTAGGGAVGIIAGPLGILIGLTIGGIAGGVALAKDKEAVRIFNNSYLN